jgi:hypothetical protein
MSRPVLIADVETAPRDECRKYVKPAGNVKDPAKVAASIEERCDKLAVDINGARIVVLGWWDAIRGDPIARICLDDDAERLALGDFWLAWKRMRTVSANAQVAGYYCRTFDLPLLIRRSQLLGVTPEHVSLARYGRGDVCDLYDELTFHEGGYSDGVVPRTLKVFCEQFDIDVPGTDIDGAMVPGLVAAGDLEPVREHNLADLIRVGLLGQRLGLFDCRVPALI